ncbi:TonB-dependent receptor [Flammeovirga aprica]|uniref:TonB-dependent receptor plug domain-containing protein n=1 Tax=Flammeovirga aprica JL-4 TaxID=694437 RepID=A0A7X9RUC3_9BACT|nr:TonB-dependent receptor [Flammeovirga aprica]NME68866.1 TonB-dependent receptor plug domain-containing protein [Flammeovirga aprica JL-4]
MCPLLLWAQGPLFTAQFHEQPLKKVLKEIEHHFGVYFSFNEKLLAEKKVNIDFDEATLEKALVQALAGSELEYEVLDEQFIVIRKRTIQKINIKGIVSDTDNNTLPYTTIESLGTQKYAVSDVDGKFSVSVPANDTLLIKFLGFEDLAIPVAGLDTSRPLDIALRVKKQSLPELVYETQLDSITSLIDGQSRGKNVKNAGIGNLPTSDQEDVFYALKLLPGVSTAGLSSALEVRGGETDQNLTLIDKFPMYQLDHYFGLQSVVNPDITNSATLYPGGYDCLYGARVSSILDIGLKNPTLYHTEGNVGVSLLGYKAYLSTPIIRGKLAVLGTFRKYHGAIERLLYDRDLKTGDSKEFSDGEESVSIYNQSVKPDINYHDANAKMIYQINKDQNITFSYLYSQDNYYSAFDLPLPLRKLSRRNTQVEPKTNSDTREWSNNAMSLGWNLNTKKLNSSVYFTYSDNTRENEKVFYRRDTTNIKPLKKTTTFSKQKMQDISFHSDQQIYLKNGRLDVGGIYTYYSVYKDIKPNSFLLKQVDSLTSSQSVGLYTQYNFYLNKLSLTVGSRLWYYQPSNKTYLAPRIQGTLPVGNSNLFSLKFSAGRYYQFIRELSDELTYDSYWIISDDENIPVITSNHFIGGGTFRWLNHAFDIEGYYKRSTGEMSDLTFRNPVYFHKYIGDGDSYGVDLMYEYNARRWYFYMSYGYNQYNKQYTPKEAERKRTSILQLASMYKRKKWKAGFTWVMKNTAYDFNELLQIPQGTNNEQPKGSDVEPYDIPLYHRLDFSSEYNFRIGKRMKGEIVLTIYDLYNQQNTEERQVTQISPEITNNYEYVLTDISQLGITPNLSFNLIF